MEITINIFAAIAVIVAILSIWSARFRTWFWSTLVWDSIRHPFHALRRFASFIGWIVMVCVVAWLISWTIDAIIAHFMPGYGFPVFPSPLELWYMGSTASASSGGEPFNLFSWLDHLKKEYVTWVK